MAFKGKATNGKGGGEGGDYPKVPPANHPAALVGIIDLGTHKQRKWQSEEMEDVHKVFLLWELTEEKVPGLPENFLIGRDYRLSFGEKAGLRLMLEGWRGKGYAEGEEIDLGAVLGKKCLLNVKNKPSKKDPQKSYPQIENVSAPPRGTKISDPLNKPVAWEIGVDTLDQLPAFVADYFHYGQSIKDCIADAKEMKGRPQPAAPVPAAAGVGDANEGPDEIPF